MGGMFNPESCCSGVVVPIENLMQEEPTIERLPKSELHWTFSSRESPVQFRLRQSFDSWLFLHQIFDRDHHSRTAGLWIEHTAHAKKQRFITITSGPQGTTV